ncbi:hypothetical protein KO516_13060 [Citreicella sp. C3M06]|uniref:hypothetical protein n=1 Tax=Citreicella sp. C3M06 TaxID=2841564 RepID=UPI001C08FB1D|nr:hypothetical protein [Citreicella sp. C3M06]MBU2961726.1 hypothetical protein [Citreicella sp. C3M06]
MNFIAVPPGVVIGIGRALPHRRARGKGRGAMQLCHCAISVCAMGAPSGGDTPDMSCQTGLGALLMQSRKRANTATGRWPCAAQGQALATVYPERIRNPPLLIRICLSRFVPWVARDANAALIDAAHLAGLLAIVGRSQGTDAMPLASSCQKNSRRRHPAQATRATAGRFTEVRNTPAES